MSTGIEWCDETWNPVVGCDRVSPGCAHCYAKQLHDQRHKAYLAGKPKIAPQYAVPFETVQLIPERLEKPLSWRAPKRIFVNSVSDLFHDDVPVEFIDKVFAVMALCDGKRSNGRHHTFQVLTKRPERMRAYLTDAEAAYRVAAEVCLHSVGFRPVKGMYDWSPWREWPLPNLWLGVSVENQRWADERIPLLLDTPAAVRFLSCEPLLGPVALDRGDFPFIDSIDWVIVGGESGPKARPVEATWVQSLRAQCAVNHVPFLFKQWGGRTPKSGGRELDGRTWDEYPSARSVA